MQKYVDMQIYRIMWQMSYSHIGILCGKLREIANYVIPQPRALNGTEQLCDIVTDRLPWKSLSLNYYTHILLLYPMSINSIQKFRNVCLPGLEVLDLFNCVSDDVHVHGARRPTCTCTVHNVESLLPSFYLKPQNSQYRSKIYIN